MRGMNLNYLFNPGKITTIMDGSFGSSGKGSLGSFIAEHSDRWSFCCNTFMPQAGHWVKLDDGREFFYQTLNSCAYLHHKFDKMYIAPASVIELDAFWREMKENNVPYEKVGISPVATILVPEDGAFERGEMDLDGNVIPVDPNKGTSKKGSTCHGCGAAVAKKVLRKKNVVYAGDVPELKQVMCDVSGEIMERLRKGESGFGELAQGYPLSLNHPLFKGYTTSRNVTTAQFYADLFVPVKYAGPVIINFRSYPIRINSNKYIGEDGKHLGWDDVEAGVPHKVYEGDSGSFYPDSQELDWDTVTKISGSPDKIFECTSVTRLPRRVATFSNINLVDALEHNETEAGVYISLSFADYVDHKVKGVRDLDNMTEKTWDWIKQHIGLSNANLMFIGTGPLTEDFVVKAASPYHSR